jgi:hypothetical protein
MRPLPTAPAHRAPPVPGGIRWARYPDLGGGVVAAGSETYPEARTRHLSRAIVSRDHCLVLAFRCPGLCPGSPTSEALRGYAGGSPPSATNRNFSEFFISPSVTITAFPFTASCSVIKRFTRSDSTLTTRARHHSPPRRTSQS